MYAIAILVAATATPLQEAQRVYAFTTGACYQHATAGELAAYRRLTGDPLLGRAHREGRQRNGTLSRAHCRQLLPGILRRISRGN